MIYDIYGSHIKTINSTLTQAEDELEDCLLYVVDLGGNLHVVQRYVSEIFIDSILQEKTWKFDIYKLDFITQKLEILSCLGGWSIFVGNNNSFSISTSDHPEIQSNSIYFADDYIRTFDTTSGSYEMGIYNLENHKILPFTEGDIWPSMRFVPLWIKPGLE